MRCNRRVRALLRLDVFSANAFSIGGIPVCQTHLTRAEAAAHHPLLRSQTVHDMVEEWRVDRVFRGRDRQGTSYYRKRAGATTLPLMLQAQMSIGVNLPTARASHSAGSGAAALLLSPARASPQAKQYLSWKTSPTPAMAYSTSLRLSATH